MVIPELNIILTQQEICSQNGLNKQLTLCSVRKVSKLTQTSFTQEKILKCKKKVLEA